MHHSKPSAGAVALALCLATAACKKAPPEPVTSTPDSFTCDPAAVPHAVALRRLSRHQYVNTVSELIRFADAADPDAVLSELGAVLAALPADTPLGPDKHYGAFTSLDQAIQQEHADGIYALALAAGKSLTSSPARLGALAGSCATDADPANDAACVADLIRRLGERALRRAITDADVAFYSQPAAKPPLGAADYADVVALLLSAPESLFFVESGADPTASPAPLGAYELASRISYHFWQTLPDEQLFARARSGELLTEAGYQAEVERVFADPRTRLALSSFYAEWLANTTLNGLDARLGTPVYDAIRGDFTPGPDTRQHLLDEVVDAARYYSFDTPGSFDDFFNSARSFGRTADVAQIYGIPPWDGVSPPPVAPGRSGLLTRPAFVATGSNDTRPIMKGVFIRKAILCDSIAPPPGNAAANPPPSSAHASTRQVVENLTQTGICASCHPLQINPLGFATENFDPLGRLRNKEPLFDDQGQPTGLVPIDTTSMPRVTFEDTSKSSGAGDLHAILTRSPKLHACFARQYFRFTFGRMEDGQKDGCALSDVKKALDAEAPLPEVLRAIALSPSFKTRSFQEVSP